MGQNGTLRIAVVGAGRWGQHVVRNFASARRCALQWICDRNEQVLERMRRSYPAVRMTTDFDELLNDQTLQAVAIVTDAAAHVPLTRQALEAGKHVYCEKPLAMTTADAAVLAELADRRQQCLMVGHLLEYHPSVQYLRQMIRDGRLGRVYYLYSQRLNLGVVRQDQNAWWSLAPHDISAICYLFEAEPVSVAASGRCFLQPKIEDVVFATLSFADGRLANIHVSWLDPHKIRKMTVVGTERMVSFDDMAAAEKIRIYDKSACYDPRVGNFAEAISLRTGDVLIPKVDLTEPLRIECQHFVDAVLDGRAVRSDARDGLRVVRVLEAGSESLRCGGQPIAVKPDPKL
ncbi:MAG: Gfo/Idh/MocA family protein [Phycisphaerae bacterium]